MSKLALVLAAVGSFAAIAAHAETVVTDTDANGTFSMEEMKAAYVDLTEETFKAVDANADGAVDADELKAAIEAGVLPA
ncbi:MAG: EF-hand domain-containing protein [Paracoccaceae bacterium]